MTPNQLINALKVPQDKVDRIKALAHSLEELEEVLHEYDIPGHAHTAETPFRQGIRAETQQCVYLIAKITGKGEQAVLSALLALFGITQEQLDRSCTVSSKIVALSALIAAGQH